MRPLHVCFLSQEYPPETGWGGIGAYTQELAHGLARAGQKVTVISLAERGEDTVSRAEGVEVHRIRKGPNWGRIRGLWRLNRVWPGFAWSAARRLRQVHSQFPVDIVEAAECRADSLFARLVGPRRPALVVRLHTPWIMVDRLNGVAPDAKKRLIYWQEACAIRSADLVTAPSQAVVDLTESWVPLRRRAVQVIPNPVNARLYAPAGTKTRTTEVLIVGRLEQNKGAALLAESMPAVLRACPNVSFRYVGRDGGDANGRPWRERLLDGVAAADRSRVHFEQLPREQLIERYRRAAACVLPSLWENFPYALLEAMSCGVPVIGTRTGGVPELIEDGVSGLIVPPADPTALTEALCRLLQNSGLRQRMGHAARQRVEERFSVEAIVPRMLDLYRSVRARRAS
jgi:glycogen(starch) synthase